MRHIETDPKTDLAIRNLLVRLRNDDLETIYSVPYGGELPRKLVDDYKIALFKLKYIEMAEVEDECYLAMREFLRRLDFDYANKVLSREWAGSMLQPKQIEEYRDAIFMFFFSNFKVKA